MRTIDKIITLVNSQYGAPMGRANVGTRPLNTPIFPREPKIFDCYVPMSRCGTYDTGGAYWGRGRPLRVFYTKDLKYIEFYRVK